MHVWEVGQIPFELDDSEDEGSWHEEVTSRESELALEGSPKGSAFEIGCSIPNDVD